MALAREDIDAPLAARLIAEQFPRWAHLPVRPVAHSGWDNRTFHLGDELLIRLPSHPAYAAQVAKEQAWLPRLAPLLPMPIPAPVAEGAPTEAYPLAWSVYRWIEGEPAATAPPRDWVLFAKDVAGFLSVLYRVDASDGPPPGPHSFQRGAHVTVYDQETRDALAALEGRFDTRRLTAHWEAAMATHWEGPPVWSHGDIALGNLLVKDGSLCAVIDFGCSSVGDPACDLAIAWTDFHGEAREAFRAALSLDEGTWRRGLAWALWKAAITAARPDRSFEPWITRSKTTLEEILAEPL